MTILKNLHLIPNESLREELELLAKAYYRFGRVSFKIKSLEDEVIVVQISQSKSPQDNYCDSKRLVEIGHEMFDEYFKKVIIHPIPFEDSPVEVVDAVWLKEKIKLANVQAKDLVFELGIPKSDLSGMINSHKPIGTRSKGVFFYYFKYKSEKAEKKLLEEQVTSLLNDIELFKTSIHKLEQERNEYITFLTDLENVSSTFEVSYDRTIKKLSFSTSIGSIKPLLEPEINSPILRGIRVRISSWFDKHKQGNGITYRSIAKPKRVVIPALSRNPDITEQNTPHEVADIARSKVKDLPKRAKKSKVKKNNRFKLTTIRS